MVKIIKSETFNRPCASFAELPAEILIEIAKHLHRDEFLGLRANGSARFVAPATCPCPSHEGPPATPRRNFTRFNELLKLRHLQFCQNTTTLIIDVSDTRFQPKEQEAACGDHGWRTQHWCGGFYGELHVCAVLRLMLECLRLERMYVKMPVMCGKILGKESHAEAHQGYTPGFQVFGAEVPISSFSSFETLKELIIDCILDPIKTSKSPDSNSDLVPEITAASGYALTSWCCDAPPARTLDVSNATPLERSSSHAFDNISKWAAFKMPLMQSIEVLSVTGWDVKRKKGERLRVRDLINNTDAAMREMVAPEWKRWL